MSRQGDRVKGPTKSDLKTRQLIAYIVKKESSTSSKKRHARTMPQQFEKLAHHFFLHLKLFIRC